MKKILFFVSVILSMAFILGAAAVQSQPGRSGYVYGMGPGYGYGMGPGMMGNYGYGYGMGPGMMDGGWIEVPDKLPVPKSTQWVQKLREIMTLEKESLAQYEADQEKFNAFMPYMMVIPQEENHVDWIGQLFKAYGLPADGKTPSVTDNKSLTDAYELSVKMENELLPRYEWLIRNAGDRDTAQVLNVILLQSRWHLVMFDHALRMGHGYGFSRGWGMGPGMMGGYYDFGTGRSYGRQYPPSGKTIELKEAEAMMKDYLRSSRNPNLKLGKIQEKGNLFEAEILSKNNDLVDKVFIDKRTGDTWSAYR